MDLLFITSILASFLAGMIALLAPCCITVVLPAYLASALRQKKQIIKMTLVFFFGIAVILVPIGLGAASLARVFQNFHEQMYIVGAILMIILAIMSVSGKGMSLIPMPKRAAPSLDVTHSRSVFMLGIFSGAATSCCAPVLAGAITLAVVSTGFLKALIVTLVYVFGMIFPLLVAAFFYDRFRLEESRIVRGKLLEIKTGNKKFYVHSTNLVAGIVFLVMGIILLYLAFSGNEFWAPSFQGKISAILTQWTNTIIVWLENLFK